MTWSIVERRIPQFAVAIPATGDSLPERMLHKEGRVIRPYGNGFDEDVRQWYKMVVAWENFTKEDRENFLNGLDSGLFRWEDLISFYTRYKY